MSEHQKLANNEYRCAVCGGVYLKGWSDSEAEDELSDVFPGISKDECDLVCDDCYKAMGFK